MRQETRTVEDVILEALREGPKTGKQLQEIGDRHHFSRQTVSFHVKKLRGEKRIQLGVVEGAGRRPVITYELARESMEERVKNAIRRFADLMQRYPDPIELAREVEGITPQQAEEIAYETSEQTHWYSPSPREKEKAESIVILGLIAAERIRQGIAQDTLPEEVELGKKFLEKYSHLLPIIVGDKVVAWPPKAKAELTKYIDEDTLFYALDQ